jgi:hypothetical protein
MYGPTVFHRVVQQAGNGLVFIAAKLDRQAGNAQHMVNVRDIVPLRTCAAGALRA